MSLENTCIENITFFIQKLKNEGDCSNFIERLKKEIEYVKQKYLPTEDYEHEYLMKIIDNHEIFKNNLKNYLNTLPRSSLKKLLFKNSSSKWSNEKLINYIMSKYDLRDDYVYDTTSLNFQNDQYYYILNGNLNARYELAKTTNDQKFVEILTEFIKNNITHLYEKKEKENLFKNRQKELKEIQIKIDCLRQTLYYKKLEDMKFSIEKLLELPSID